MRRPLLAFALAWAAGSILSRIAPHSTLLLVSAVVPLLLLAGWGRVDRSFRASAFWIVALFAVMSIGHARTRGLNEAYRADLLRCESIAARNPIELQGRIGSRPERKGDYWWTTISEVSTRLTTPSEDLGGVVDLWVPSESPPTFRTGDQVGFLGNLRPYSREIARKQDGIANWHESRGAVGSVFLSDPEALEPLPSEPRLRDRLLSLRDSWKTAYRDWVERRLPNEGAGLLLAMTVGDRSRLDPLLREALTRSGLLHLTAISGLHVTALILSLPSLLKLFGLKRRQRAFVAIGFALALLFLVGNRPPVLRAVLMGSCLLLGFLLDRSRDSLNFLGGACFLNLAVSPFDLFTPGFQFSYFVVGALLLWGRSSAVFVDWADDLLSRQPFLPPTSWTYSGLLWGIGWLATGVWSSFVAVAAAAPVSLYHFHQAALGALIGNLVAIPLAVALTTLGMAAAFGGWAIPYFSEVAAALLNWTSGMLANWIRRVADWDLGFYRAAGFHPLQALIPFGVLLMLRQEQRWLEPVRMTRRTACLLLLVVLALLPYFPAEKVFRATFLDVGQGDSILLEFPHGERILVDAGPPRAAGPGNVSPIGALLLSRGIGKLDGVFITHPEADHFGGFARLIDEIPIETFFCSGDVNPSGEFARFAEAVAARGIPVERVLHGDRLSGIRDATVTVLSPFLDDLVFGLGDRNERSVVLLVESQGLRTLLPGDIGEPQESRLVEAGLIEPVDLLKVPHHGSRYSSTDAFLNAANPRAAVVQCGVNTHGHPAPEVVERITEAGIPLFSTLFDGVITAVWDGKKLLIETGE